MAQLKDLIVAGASRFIGDVYANKIQLTSLSAPTTAGGTTYGVGTSGNYLRSNGTSLYWDALDAADIPSLSADKITSGTLPVGRGGTGATTFTSGAALIGNGTGAVGTRSITNNTTATAVTASTNLITANTLYYHKGNSNIVTVGTITSGTWNGTTVGTAYGGTGNTSFTANRVVYSESATKLSTSGHYASSDKIAINSTTAPSYNLYVNGTSYFSGNATHNGIVYFANGTTYYIDNSGTGNLNSLTLAATTDVSGGNSASRTGSLVVSGGIHIDKGLKVGKWTNTSTAPGAGIKVHDLRDITYTGNIFGDQAVNWYFDQVNSNWVSSMSIKGWTGSYYSWEIAGNATDSSVDKYYVRTSPATGTAGTWHTLVYLPAFAAIGSSTQPVYVDANGKVTAITGNIANGTTGNAATATALTSSAGSMLNPVYFSGGKPVAASGNAVPFITGTGSTAGTWEGTLTGLTAYYDGLLILYKPSVAGASTTTLNINGLGAKTVYLNGTTKLTTHYPASQPILLVYSTSQNSGCWEAIDNYDSNTTPYGIRVYRQNAGYNGDYPLLVSRTAAGSIGTAGTDASYTNNIYGVIWDTTTITPTLNPSTGLMKVPGGITANITGNVTGSSGSCTGNAATATKLATARTINGTSFDGSGNITTANWGTARNISISDSDGTNTGTAVSVNGSGAVTLKLPATIKASLSGNATTATSATSATNATNTAKVALTNATDTTLIYVVGQSTTTAGNKDLYYNSKITITTGSVLKGAAWNDYAEYRETNTKIEPGRTIQEIGNDSLRLADGRLLPGCEIVSDTFGFAIGETERCGTPVAATGRVLAYPYEDRELFRSYIGAPVCSGPNGTVSIMTEEEEMKYPSRIIGTISAVPDYEEWGAGKVKVNGRVWIRIR